MFPENIIESVHELRRHYKGKKTCVIMNYPILEIVIIHSDRELSLKLFYFPKTNTFEIQPMDGKYCQKISFYDYRNKNERRWVRNKELLFSIITNLKKCGLWEMVSNKDFLTINEHNEKKSASDRDFDLQQIISEKKKPHMALALSASEIRENLGIPESQASKILKKLGLK
jgi:hypothetical protein